MSTDIRDAFHQTAINPQPEPPHEGWGVHEKDAAGMWFRPSSGAIYPLFTAPCRGMTHSYSSERDQWEWIKDDSTTERIAVPIIGDVVFEQFKYNTELHAKTILDHMNRKSDVPAKDVCGLISSLNVMLAVALASPEDLATLQTLLDNLAKQCNAAVEDPHPW